MMRAQVCGAWTVNRTPQLLADYPHPQIATCDDVTGTANVPPAPNLGVWEITAESITEIKPDADYLVLLSEEVVDVQA